MALDKNTFKKAYENKYKDIHGDEIENGNNLQRYEALGSLMRDYVSWLWLDTNKRYNKTGEKQIYYFSMEFLLGRLLGDTLMNLGLIDICKEALAELNIDLRDLEELEEDQGLGNGGLGRLAACFLDSMASLGIAGHGCGIRYKYGFFEQKIIDGKQVELSDNWLRQGNVWERRKIEKSEVVKFGGEVKVENIDGRIVFTQINYEPVLAVPYDTPIVGYENNVANTLRLWSAETVSNEFDYSSFSSGEYLKAIEYKNSVESISQVLYPEDSFYEGKILRLKQQYFFVSAGIQSIIRHYKAHGGNIKFLDEKISIHINDTHPTLAIPELMRILLDEEGLGWEEAWRITTNIVSYTNHTILAEALEKWPIDMFKGLLPRIYMIVEEINERFCSDLWNKYIGQWEKISDMAIIADGQVRMANLAVVGSHSVNGVAKLHTEILKKEEMKNLYYFYPNKFNNKTNGITHRRWLLRSNPGLTNLLCNTIGDSFIKHPTDLINFEKFTYDKGVQEELERIKKKNKERLAEKIYKKNGIIVDTSSIFDVQVKRIHGYKRQTLNCLRIMDLYNKLTNNPNLDIHPRTFIFAGKAAPGYYLAKNIIELINAIADKVNNDPLVNKKIKVVFLENYNVSLAEEIIPAADLSEQISTTTKEASGTSNMKFMMNGAITLGTLDGANVEIAELVGEENCVIFGMKDHEVKELQMSGAYKAWDYYNNNPRLKRIIDSLMDGTFHENREEFRVIFEELMNKNDEYFVLADYEAYCQAQSSVRDLYKDRSRWAKVCLTNIAKSGFFSSDRTIQQYVDDIWHLDKVKF